MNNDKQPDARRSLCWKCKFGICVKEVEVEQLYQAQSQAPENDKFVIFDVDNASDEIDISELTVENDRVKAVCYWRPAGIQSPPILVAEVKQCNRFEE